MSTNDKIREKVREIRLNKGFTQAEVAELIPMSTTGYAKLERGVNNFSSERLKRLADILGVHMEEFIPKDSEGMVVINNSSDVLNNSPLSVAIGDPALEAKITKLNIELACQKEIISSREREIEALKSQIEALKEVISALKNV